MSQNACASSQIAEYAPFNQMVDHRELDRRRCDGAVRTRLRGAPCLARLGRPRRENCFERPSPGVAASTKIGTIQCPILHGFRHVGRVDPLLSREVRDRPRDFQNAIVRTRGKTESLDRSEQQTP